ncbi:hypothetical protein NXY56_000998 [Leishmania guyanensis]|uniref:Uncharacterized protein n=1 Tax=Leishmania guyanensis TaxID=5670 RepID=A0A1E1ISS2_LEIGU|nr:hypothetical protein, conserved [Leishmania guyanensis]
MNSSSPLLSSFSAASGPVPSPFVPCTEDSAHTRRVGRHPALFQRTLDVVNYRYLTASSRLTRTVVSSRSNSDAGSVALPATATAKAAHAAYVATLTANYQELWQQRGAVPKAARREWFETVLVHLKALNALGAALAWLTDAPTEVVDAATAAAPDGAIDVDMITTGGTGSISSVASDALFDRDGEQREQRKPKKAAHDPLPLWYLWQDAQRHLHHMTLRLRPWTPAAGGAHGTREAMRMSDLVHMDSSAFAWRVRQWCHIAALFHCADTEMAMMTAASSPATIPERIHPGMIVDVVRHVSPVANSSISPASPLPGSLLAEEPEVAHMLLLCLRPTPANAAGDILARQHVAGALVYRMLLEVTLGRLRALPRCIFTWRLLRDVVCDHLIASAPGFLDINKAQKAVLLVITAYVEVVVIPYLQHRDCHLESLRHTVTQVHAQFTRLASAKLEQLRAAVSSTSAEDADKAGAVAQSESETAAEVVDVHGAAAAPAAVGSAEDTKGEQGCLPEAQRQRMATSMEFLLRSACTGGAPAFAKTEVQMFSTPCTANESEAQGAQGIIASTILGNTVAVDKAKREAGDGQQGDASTAPSGMWEEELFSMRRDFHRRRVDDSVLHTSAVRIAQLRLFLYHYFTQSPTRAFDRVSDSDTAAAAEARDEGEGK